jgi:hypothetical protein
MTRTIINNTVYITAQARGVEYTLSRNGDGWFLASRRIALGRFNTGDGKHYATLADVAAGCKAFADLGSLQAAVFGLGAEVAA